MKIPGLALMMFLFVSIHSKGTAPRKHINNFLDLPLRDFIQLSPQEFYTVTGQKMKLKDKLQFAVVKLAMKKAIRKNRDMTVREFLSSKKNPGAIGGVFLVLGAIVLVMFVLFMVLYKP
jgi:hypothetical protein